MNGEWTILLWILVGVVFLMKITAVRDLVTHIRKMSAPGIICMVLSLGYFANVSYTKEGISTNQAATQNESLSPNNSSFIIENSSLSSVMPTWWNGSDTDTDEDGIPDDWEKWTHGNRLVDDDDLDRDSDGLTDLEEFQNQTDPRTADTDGDGFSDAFEVANGMNPTSSEDFTPVEPDADNNGRIDLWENAPYLYGFTDADHDGFDDYYELDALDPESDENFDVVVDVYTTRSAVLTWANTNRYGGIVILPTTGTSVKLRLPFRMHTELKLLCSPETESSYYVQSGIEAMTSGVDDDMELWKAQIKAKYAARHHPEGGFLDDGDGSFVELVQPKSSAIEALLSGVGSSTAECRIFVESHSSSVSSLVFSGCCVHSDPVMFWCDKAETDHVVSYSWTSDPSGIFGSGMTNFVGLGNLAAGTYAVKCTVECKRNWWTNSRTTYSIASLNVYDCSSPPTVLSVYDNEWHVPTNSPAGCGTPELVYIGFDHAKVKTRNLSRITTGNVEEDTTEHCLGVVWEDEGEIDLFSLLGNNSLSYKDDLQFTTTSYTIDDGRLIYGKNPDDLSPNICFVEVLYTPNSLTLDRLWIVVNSTETSAMYESWLRQNVNNGWVLTLPQPFSNIELQTNSTGIVIPIDPETGSPNQWGTPHPINSYLHHDACFEMRSSPVGDHGHQATYDSSGSLITQAIASGTADIYAPYSAGESVRWSTRHRNQDVYPFIRALQLDGNPIFPVTKTVPKHLNRPCIYKGDAVNLYLYNRPIIPTGIQ